MKRNLIALAAAALALGTTAAFADNNYTFDDEYWKKPQTQQTVQPMLSTQSESKYSHVDDFNP
jgi:hypothetical protein